MAVLEDGSVMIVMGISAANVERLKAGEPIYFDPAALRVRPGATIKGISLFYGDDEAALAETLRALIGPTTQVHAVPRGDPRPQ